MESIIFMKQGVPLINLFSSLPYSDKEGEPFMHETSNNTIRIMLFILVIVLFYNYKRAGTKLHQSPREDYNDDCHQKAIHTSPHNKNTEVIASLKREMQYNLCVTLKAREDHNQKLALHDLQIRYNVKRGLDLCESKAQCDGTTKDEKNLTEDYFDDLQSQNTHEINSSVCGRIKMKDLEFQVSFSEVSYFLPLEINKIPWREMNKEWWRLHTFSKYPRNSSCSSILLARQGFVYIGNGSLDDDTIVCVFCLSAAKDLGIDTDIAGLHHTLNPNCPIVRGRDCQNIMIKESDGKNVSYILSMLKQINSNTSSTIIGQQYEDQALPLESDSSSNPSHSGVSTAAHNTGNSKQESKAHATSQKNNNSRFDTCHQATENDASYEVVTNCAQSLSLPGAEDTNAESSNRIYEAQQLVTPAARPDSVPSSAAPSSKPPTGGSARRNQNRNSESSRPHTQSNNSTSHTSRPEVASDGISSSQETPGNSTSSPSATISDSQEAPSSNTTSYDKLGIITARPKRPEYAVEITRLNSFEGWPQDHHIKSEDLAKAGYFYTGYSDCARCFYCGGGLRNWEVGDDVWVEHARWFPKCAFMRQIMGQPFIDVVQDLNKEKEIIPYEDVIAEMRYRNLEHAIPKEIKDKSIELERDAAVITIIDNGFKMDDTVMAAEKLKETGQSLSADTIYEELEKRNVTRQSTGLRTDDDSRSISKKGNEKKDQELFESLRGENSQLRQQSQCKICMDKEVSVVFLPCGHFISCSDCSFALKSCPVCRDNIKGVVRAYLK